MGIAESVTLTQIEEIRVPDIGDFDNIPVVEVLVSVGETVTVEQSLVTLESDKASMDVPAPTSGVIKTLDVAVGDEVSEGALILTLEHVGSTAASAPEEVIAMADAAEPNSLDRAHALTESVEIRVPDIGDFTDIPVIEILVSVGDSVQADEPLVTLESDKASMDVPSPQIGSVASLAVSVGDTLSEGDLILTLESTPDGAAMTASEDDQPNALASDEPKVPRDQPAAADVSSGDTSPARTPTAAPRGAPTANLAASDKTRKRKSHATPSVRRFARELGVDLSEVVGTGRKGRIIDEDVRRYVKEALSGSGRERGLGVPTMPAVDFSKFGEIEVRPLGRIKTLSGANLHRSWLVVPHVTHHDETDVTELEAFRKTQLHEAKSKGIKLTPLAFIMKASMAALKKYPSFNASLDPDGENLILKHYVHIGVAVDTPDGLMVPVVRDVDKKGVMELAEELGTLSAKARDKKLSPADMQGGCFTISSLGGIGGTSFTPIVNAPEVAILGVSRSSYKPVYSDGEFVPRLMLPLSLSYDHRVIDGAAAARFARFTCETLSDIRRLLL